MQRASIPWTVKQIHKMTNNNSLVFDNAVQRGYVWDIKRKSLLIDSILRGYPIPPFYTIKDGRKVKTPKGDVAVYDALDGKQRCLTIAKFKDNEFALKDIEDTILDDDGTEIDLNGLTYEELPESLRDAFDSYSLTVHYFTDCTEDEIIEIMARLNNGKSLTAAENTRIKALDLKGLKEIASHELFSKCLSERALNGYQNEDTVMKVYAVTNNITSLENKTLRTLYETTKFESNIKTHLGILLDFANEIYDILLSEDKKKKPIAKKFTTRTHFVSCAKMLEKALAENKSAEQVADFLIEFYAGKPSIREDYNVASRDGSNQKPNVDCRLKAVDEEYNRYFTANP